ncbi:hypothetical protein ACLPHM_01615 [Paenalcaligenes sp. Me131]|uniref:hypothetical protein n=1 Tax=Paenalcaligenes sp. Me131 TaxID=3392636 RepID=UPI003D2C0778
MTPKLMRVLRKLYKYQNAEYDAERRVSIYNEQILSDKERDILQEHQWQSNAITYFADHDDVIEKLRSLKNSPELTQERILTTFIAGVGGSYLRGRSVLSAWSKLNNIAVHTYLEKPEYRCCWVCADHNEPNYLHDSHLQYCLYVGNAYSSTPTYAYLNLAHLLTQPVVAATAEDKHAFLSLIDLLRNAPDDETPGQFEKRLTAAKIIKGDVYTKRGILDSLARLGVIPNQFITLSDRAWTNFGDIVSCENQLKNTKGRSDMEMPWAGWKGRLKVDEAQLQKVFGAYV